ncbi:MAG: hypothetical protein ABIZ72_04960 [Candidatus Limnocylindrales bacterium]
MKKMSRMPHEQSLPDGSSGPGPEHDGLPAIEGDVEGHRATRGNDLLPGMPGTGGDNLHRPIGSGEADGDDVEGHLMGHTKGERFLPGMPGTGGDGIAVDAGDEDVEAHGIND